MPLFFEWWSLSHRIRKINYLSLLHYLLMRPFTIFFSLPNSSLFLSSSVSWAFLTWGGTYFVALWLWSLPRKQQNSKWDYHFKYLNILNKHICFYLRGIYQSYLNVHSTVPITNVKGTTSFRNKTNMQQVTAYDQLDSSKKFPSPLHVKFHVSYSYTFVSYTYILTLGSLIFVLSR